MKNTHQTKPASEIVVFHIVMQQQFRLRLVIMKDEESKKDNSLYFIEAKSKESWTNLQKVGSVSEVTRLQAMASFYDYISQYEVTRLAILQRQRLSKASGKELLAVLEETAQGTESLPGSSSTAGVEGGNTELPATEEFENDSASCQNLSED